MNTANFFKSKDVKVFPCTYRGNYNNSATFDPESRLNTEYNFTHLASVGDNLNSYIVECQNNILRCIIGGYYFEISHIDSYNLRNKVLSINTRSIIIRDSSGAANDPESERTTQVLKSCLDDIANLDVQEDNEWYFTGIKIDDSASGKWDLKVFLSNGDLNREALKPTIKHGSGEGALKIGENTEATGNYTFAEGQYTKASGPYSHAEGCGELPAGAESPIYTEAAGKASHAEGYQTQALKEASHAEGINTAAKENASHAEGDNTIADCNSGHAEGSYTKVDGSNTYYIKDGVHYYGRHAEGGGTTASKAGAHAEGLFTTASGTAAHAEGFETEASGNYSHAGGIGTKASKPAQTVVGKYNKNTSGEFIVGIGEDDDHRDNELVVSSKTTTIKNTLKVINNSNKTKFETNPDKTEITTATNNITGTTNSISGTTNTITATNSSTTLGVNTISGTTNTFTSSGSTTISNGDASQTQIVLDKDNSNKHRAKITSATIAVESSGDTTLNNKNLTVTTTTKIQHKIGDASNSSEKLVITSTDTEISNTKITASGSTNLLLKQDNANKIELADKKVTITSTSTKITNGTENKGVEINVKDQGTQINLDGNDLFSKWIREYILSTAYPIGSIYMSDSQYDGTSGHPDTRSDSTKNGCPLATELGGEWERIQGEFLYAAEVNAGTHGEGNADTTNYGINAVGGSKNAVLISHNHSMKAAGGHSHNKGDMNITGKFPGVGWEHSGDFGGAFYINGTSSVPVVNSGGKVDYEVGFSAADGWTGYTNEVDDHTHTINYSAIDADGVAYVTESQSEVKGVGSNMPPYLCIYAWKRIA